MSDQKIFGYDLPFDDTTIKVGIMAGCKNCNRHWREEITIFSGSGCANSKSYDYCSECNDEPQSNTLGRIEASVRAFEAFKKMDKE